MKLCMGCMNEIEDHLSTCPYCGFNETALRQESYYLDPGTIIGGKYSVLHGNGCRKKQKSNCKRIPSE